MNDITKDTFAPPPKANPIFAGLPVYLKDPANYMKIQKSILDTLAGKCSHGEIVEWASCPKCQRRFTERGQFIKKLGFKSMGQYMAWQKVHQEIINMQRNPLKKYDE